jgi:hypothetical protein
MLAMSTRFDVAPMESLIGWFIVVILLLSLNSYCRWRRPPGRAKWSSK